jgi:Ca2+-binding RTX toxin-like protein
MNGGDGDDRLFGNRHNDTLNGGAGNDKLSGGGDNDILNGQAGNDSLKGGDGNDTFIFERGSDRDLIEDFGLGADRLRLDTDLLGGASTRADIIDAFASVSGGNTIMNFGGSDVLTLEGFTDLDLLAGQVDTF